MATSIESPKDSYLPPVSTAIEADASARQPTIYTASPTYSLVSEKLRRASAGSLQCSLFCGGQRCKYEVPHRWKEEDKALRGLFSHWVTENVLAMARPSTVLFRDYQLIDQFKSCGISTVINLQLPWEHSKCGPGIESSGFTYQPEELMGHGVYFYNYGWMDYGVPTLESVLDMVKVVDFAVKEGKVAIHCHAGLGRTGVLIACYLIYSKRMGGDEAITAVREKRPGSIQTRQQIDIVQQFSSFLSPLWQLYPSTTITLTLQQYLSNQALLLHGYELQDLKFIPKAVYDVCNRLDTLCSRASKLRNSHQCTTMNGSANLLDNSNYDQTSGDSQLQKHIEALQTEMNTSLQWHLLNKENSPVVLLHMLFAFFRTLKEPFLSADDVSTLEKNRDFGDLSEAQSCTLDNVLNTLRRVFSVEGTLSQHGPRLASQLAKLFTQQQCRMVNGDELEKSIVAIEKLILTSWKL